MGNQIDKQSHIQGFQLIGRDTGDPPFDRKCWHREGIYLSHICLVVHLSPAVQSFTDDAQQAQAKESLYAYLRRVSHSALEHDLMRPVACVMSKGNHSSSRELINNLRNWGSDQEWHRGSFTLYVEIPDPEQKTSCLTLDPWDRLADLLNPKIEVLTLPPESRTPKEIAKQLKKKLEQHPSSDQQIVELTGSLLGRVIEIVDPSLDQSKKLLSQDLTLKAWQTEVIQQANRIKTGEADS